jgi:hypothetical protein
LCFEAPHRNAASLNPDTTAPVIMRTDTYNYLDLLSLLGFFASLPFCVAIPHAESLERRSPSNPLNIDWDPAPAPEDGPPLSAGAIRDPAYLPIQIGGIVGSYAVALVLVAIGLLAFAKTRREHLRLGEAVENGELDLPTFQFPVEEIFKSEEEYFQAVQQYHEQQEVAELQEHQDGVLYAAQQPYTQFPAQEPRPLHPSVPYPLQTPKIPYKNFSRSDLSPASPIRVEFNGPFTASPASTLVAPGYDLAVDQSVILSDREMAQQQLEDMYKHVMEQEEAKAQGRVYQGPAFPASQQPKPGTPASSSGILKKEKNRPMGLNLDKDEKSQSRGSSIFSILKSPRKKNVKAVNISSPIMTPMSGTFPRYGEGEEMNAIPPRQYAPAPPPPVPTDRHPYYQRGNTGNTMPLTPEMSPTSMASIDGRIDAVVARQSRGTQETSHRRDPSAMTESSLDPISASSEKSTTPLVGGGLPTSPKPGVTRFPSLPASPRPGQQSFPRDSTLPSSPKPGQTFQQQRESSTHPFQRANAPTAIRAGGALPLRAYEPSLASPRLGQQTVFTRAGPLSPGLGTPYTGAAVPYSPYQPFSPVIPMTPSLVTKEDRKRMRKMEPKTPTVEMVMSSDEIW